MIRLRPVLLVLLLGLCAPAMSVQPSLAIIVDDVGNDYAAAQKLLKLPTAVTLAILPRLGNSQRIAEAAHQQGREVMLHQPMQSMHHKALGPGGYTLAHTRADLRALLDANLASVPHAVGVNNHMGSLLTGEASYMRRLMKELQQRGGLYFVDSRTNSQTVAEREAQEAGLPSARRDVFLDNVAEPAYIAAQLQQAIALAKRRGSAIAIGHPYPETLNVLAQLLPQLEAQGVRLIPVSNLIDLQRESTWHASSSPLPKVAKSSKQ